MESFFSSLKTERTARKVAKHIEVARLHYLTRLDTAC